MNNRLNAGFVWIVILYVLVAWAYNIYRPLQFITQISNISGLKSSVVEDSTSQAYLFDNVSEKEFTGRFIPVPGDTLLEIRGTLSDSLTTSQLFDLPAQKGDTVSVTIGSEYGQFQTLILYPKRSMSTLTILLLLLAVLPIPFFVVAIWAMIRRWQNAGVRVLAMLIMSLSVFFVLTLNGVLAGVQAGVQGTADSVASDFHLAWINYPAFILSSMNTGFWFHLAFLFPSPSNFLVRRRWVIYFFAYVMNFLLVLPIIISQNFTALDQIHVYQILGTGFGVIQVLFTLGLFIFRSIKTDSALEKRQIRVLLQSVGLGIVLMLIFSIAMVVIVSREPASVLGIAISFLGLIIGLMLIPAGFAYAFSKYRLLEVEGRIKRGVTFLLTSGGLLLAVFLVFYIASNLILKNIGWEGRSQIVFFTLIVAMGYVPIHNWLQSKIEKRIFRTRWRLRQMLENFLEITSSLPNRATLWDEFGKRLRENIGVRNMHVFLLDATTRQFHRLNGESIQLPGNGALQAELGKRIRALSVEEIEGSNEIVVSTQEREWLHDLGATVLVPIQIHKELVGMLALEFEYGYDEIRAEELDILASITSRVALENENLRLLEENIEKQRLEEQLATARKVQQQFLPESLPDTPGLQITASCSFCLEVAGDTFDVIPLKNGDTLFAVGDVSGKGAGAAMIMANVQASLRALTDTGLELSTMIGKINTLIAQSTSAEQFITYFAAIYHPDKHEITYVNAGHNPPRIIRSDGTISELTEGGLILGMMPDMPYDEVTLPFENGDVLVAFTDGISEATDDSEEMYGEERIVEIVQQNRLEATQQIFDRLITDLDSYTKGTPPDDDVTIFIAKAL